MSSTSSSLRVSEIFSSAGSAFNQLGELTAQLSSAQHNPGGGSGAAKWTDQEVEMLHKAVTNFANDLCQISERIKSRTVGQIKTALKKKAFEDAGMPLSAESLLQRNSNNSASSASGTSAPGSSAVGETGDGPSQMLGSSKSSADVTLNMLNASENEVDVEGLGDGRLDFDSTSHS